MCTPNRKSHRQIKTDAGFTLIELLVCIGILGILFGIVTTGVMAMRESSRKLQCQNNIRQSVLGLLQVTEKKKKIPGLGSTVVSSSTPGSPEFAGNALIAIAQELSIPFLASGHTFYFSSDILDTEFPAPPIFTCPSTGDRRAVTRLNLGIEPTYKPFVTNNFLFAVRPENLLSLQHITDGLSNTCALAERPAPFGQQRIQRGIAVDDVSLSYSEMRNNCNNAFANGNVYMLAPGAAPNWSHRYFECCYDHTRPPNVSEVDCASSPPARPIDTVIRVLISSRSFHSSGVNAAFFDGSVHFISNHVDTNTWQALGTHDQADTIGEW